jgi:hypothetical protein
MPCQSLFHTRNILRYTGSDTPADRMLGVGTHPQCLVHDACGRDVEHVFVDGRQVVANGEPVMVDARRIRAEAQAASEALWARAGKDT